MRRVKLLLVGILTASACTSLSEKPDLMAAQAADGTPCFTDRDAYFSMDYWTFDQAPDGLRSVSAKPGCELAAADLIRDYHAALRARGEPVSHAFPQGEVQFSEDGEIPLLYWHEGQINTNVRLGLGLPPDREVHFCSVSVVTVNAPCCLFLQLFVLLL